jgi:hypothetical protein
LPPNKDATLSGRTFELIKTFIDKSDAFAEEIVCLFNLMNGKGGPASVWLARLIIPHKEGGWWNPTDSRCRLLDALSSIHASMGLPCSKFAPYAARSFTPHQFGVGVSEGMEIVVHAAKTDFKYTASDSARGDPHEVLAIDCRNAFNCLGRRAIYNKMTSVFPLISKFIFWAYGSATPIYASDGTMPRAHDLSQR